LLILGLGLLLRCLVAALLPPGFDEAYYYLYTRHLDWSYFDHPPLVAWTTGLGPFLTGQVSAFSIRLGSLLLYSGSSLLLYYTGARLFSDRAGLISLAAISIAPILWIGFGVLTLPDSPLIFFTAATLWVAAQEFFPAPLGLG
jgi:4-amino-4-deoxy-L-arabinose transferase-like glycosyltransferase